MENVITEVSKYLIILLMMIYTFSCFTVFRKRDIEDQKNVLRRQIVLMLFMNLVAYTVLFLQNNDMKMLMMYGAVFLFIVVVQILYRVIYRKGNMYDLSLTTISKNTENFYGDVFGQMVSSFRFTDLVTTPTP